MKNLELIVETSSPTALKAIFDGAEESGGVVTCPDPSVTATVALKETGAAKGFGLGELSTIVLQYIHDPAMSVSLSILANWLYDRLNGRVRSVSYNERLYRVTREELRKLLEDAEKNEE